MVFTDRLKKSEIWSALILLVLHCVLLPLTVGTVVQVLGLGLSNAQWNLLYFAISFVLTIIIMRKYLRRSFDVLCDRFFRCVKYFLLAWLLYYAVMMALSAILGGSSLSGNPNDEAVTDMAKSNTNLMLAMSVFMAPIVEETIFRGGIFCGLYHKSRFWAYAASVVLFALYHVWQYALVYWDPTYLMYAILYVPAGLALCWCYDKSGSIWTSIFFHMSFNFSSIMAIQMM